MEFSWICGLWEKCVLIIDRLRAATTASDNYGISHMDESTAWKSMNTLIVSDIDTAAE